MDLVLLPNITIFILLLFTFNFHKEEYSLRQFKECCLILFQLKSLCRLHTEAS